MSRRSQKDYIAVLQAFSDLMLSALGESRLEVVEIVSDFEAALWNAVKAVFPEVHHSGCNFHWAKAVIRKVSRVLFIYSFDYEYSVFTWLQVRSLQLMAEYQKKDSGTRKSIQELLSLPYLPPELIEIQFNIIRREAPRLNGLDTFVVYIENNWIKRQLSPPKNWKVFNKWIRTNNDCEGLHYLWNVNLSQNSISFY